MIKESVARAVARAIAGHFGPEYDGLPEGELERREWNRNPGTPYTESQADVLEAAQAALDAIAEHADIEAGAMRLALDVGLPLRELRPLSAAALKAMLGVSDE